MGEGGPVEGNVARCVLLRESAPPLQSTRTPSQPSACLSSLFVRSVTVSVSPGCWNKSPRISHSSGGWQIWGVVRQSSWPIGGGRYLHKRAENRASALWHLEKVLMLLVSVPVS